MASFSQLIEKLASGTNVLDEGEKQELILQARSLENVAAIVNGMVIPGSNLVKIDNVSINTAAIDTAEIRHATAGEGHVILDNAGITLEQGELETDTQSQVKWSEAGVNHSYMLGYSSTATENKFQLEVVPVTGKDSSVLLKANSTNSSLVFAAYSGGNTHAEVQIIDANTVGNVVVRGKNGSNATYLNVTGDAALFNVHGTNVLNMDTDLRVEVGADHYFPIRTAANPNVYINEANQDMDTFIRSVNKDYMFTVDAGLDAVAIGAAPANDGSIFRVVGNQRIGGSLILENLASPSTTLTSECQAYITGGKFVIRFNDGGTVRYKYLDLTGTGVTWVHTTTAP